MRFYDPESEEKDESGDKETNNDQTESRNNVETESEELTEEEKEKILTEQKYDLKLFFNIVDKDGKRWDNRMMALDPRITIIENLDLFLDIMTKEKKELDKYHYEFVETEEGEED